GNTSHRDVCRLAIVATRQIDERNDLGRGHRLTLSVACNTRQGLEQLKRLASHLTVHFGLRARPDYNYVFRRPAGDKSSVQPIGQRHNSNEDRHHQRYRRYGHQGAAPTDDEVSEIVFEWYC